MSALLPLMSLIGVHALLVVNDVTRSLKSTTLSSLGLCGSERSRSDLNANLIRVQSIKIGFDPSSVLE